MYSTEYMYYPQTSGELKVAFPLRGLMLMFAPSFLSLHRPPQVQSSRLRSALAWAAGLKKHYSVLHCEEKNKVSANQGPPSAHELSQHGRWFRVFPFPFPVVPFYSVACPCNIWVG